MNEYIHGNVTIVVSRPSLTAEERARREKQILTALQQFGRAVQDAENKKAVAK